MINNDLVTGKPDITDTAIFNAHIDGQPTIQVIVNILNDNRAVVRFFLPRYPTDNNFAWLKRKFPDDAQRLTRIVNDYIRERGADVMYYGF